MLTGETGAGKSLILGSIGLLLGERADSEWLRAAADRSFVEGTFDLDGRPDLVEALAALEVEPEDGRVIVRRELSRDGKGRCSLNGRSVPLGRLREMGDLLVDLHGQHEHQLLLRPERQAEFFDAWAGLLEERLALERERASVLDARRALAAERESSERDRAETERLREDLAELSAAALAPGEEERLLATRDTLRHRERLLAGLEEARRALGAEDGGAEVGLRRAARALHATAATTHAEIVQECDAALVAAQDLLNRVERERAALLEDGPSLDTVEERLDRIHRLKRKHRLDLPGLLALRDELEARFRTGEPAGGDLATRERGLAAREARLAERVDALAARRLEAAPRFERAVGARLRPLGFGRAALVVTPAEPDRARPALDPTVIPSLEFEFRPNVGEPARPMRRIASGGELSRVMLAVKSLMAERDRVAVLVFDEVDQGIGGAAGDEVGRLLRSLAERRQVLCITHLPLIAAHAMRHFEVVKRTGRGRTTTSVRSLAGRDREEEIARLLAGDRVTDTTRRQARELLRGGASREQEPSGRRALKGGP